MGKEKKPLTAEKIAQIEWNKKVEKFSILYKLKQKFIFFILSLFHTSDLAKELGTREGVKEIFIGFEETSLVFDGPLLVLEIID